MPTLAILDGHSIAYRAFFALPADLATTSGQVTNAVYGFTRMLIKLLGDHQPDALAVAWDVSRQTFRSEEYADYKAQRRKTPDEFSSQLPLMRQVLDALEVPQIQREGYEADDVVASLARTAESDGWDVLAVTGDRDAFQLIDDRLSVLYMRRGISDVVVADGTWVEERYGIPPQRYVEYASLRGDTSDNLPGVPGVGEKTAARLIASYGALEGVYEHLDELTPKLRENLAAHRDQVFLNRHLMRLVDDLDFGVRPDDLRRSDWNASEVKELFTSLEFHSLWEDLLATRADEGAPAGEVLDVDTVTLTAWPAFDGAVVVELTESPEGDSLAVSLGDGRAGVIAASDGVVLSALSDEGTAVVTHDAKRLARWMLDRGAALTGLRFDTAVAAYVLNPATRTYEVEEIADAYLGLEVMSVDSDPSEGSQGTLRFDEGVDIDALGRRVEAIRRLEPCLTGLLEERDELELLQEIELPLIAVLARMEHRGISVDREYLAGLGDRLRAEITDLEAQIHDLAGGPFNVNSTDQLRDVLFNRLGLPVIKKTSTGKPSTDAGVLEKLDHPLVERLLRYRELEKLRSTYVDGYLPLVRGDGRIHTRFNQLAAATGRLSSEEPNLQNIPVRSETGKTIRRAFVAGEEKVFLVADYSQIELRILAHLCEDEALVAAFEAGEDVHTATAARVFDVDPDHVTSDMRRRAKVINFGLLYGMEAFGLAQRLDISRDEAREHMDAYFSRFPAVRTFMEGMVATARRTGYTATIFGRRRYLPELKSDNFRIRQMGERMALNAPIQGSAADIIKKAMIDLDRRLDDERIDAHQILQIHDELVLEVTTSCLQDARRVTIATMESVVTLRVPLVVDVGTGATLADAKG